MSNDKEFGSRGNTKRDGDFKQIGQELARRHDQNWRLRLRTTVLLAAGAMCAIILVACTTHHFIREQPAGTAGADFVGMDSCALCHDDIISEFRFTAHGQMRDPKGESCEACHGPGSLHVEEGDGFIVMPNDANCLACHSGAHSHRLKYTDKKGVMDWNFSHHRNAGVGCTDCHDPHSHAYMGLRIKPEFQVQNIDSTSALCLSCHQDILGRISMPYHHPIREGAMGCTSCHDPHGNMERRLLAKNETCYKCHQAQQGPFSREHQPVVEDCTICHDPHGSPVRSMARIGQPMLCLQCHSLTDNRHQNVAGVVSPAALRDCTACHGVVHGSDIDAYFRH
jgi:DmsE family decaheme c-type cytochrome